MNKRRRKKLRKKVTQRIHADLSYWLQTENVHYENPMIDLFSEHNKRIMSAMALTPEQLGFKYFANSDEYKQHQCPAGDK